MLLAFGCSNTYGTESIIDYDKGIEDRTINKQYAYPKFIADNLSCKYKNYGKPGNSNVGIARKIIEIVESEKFKEYATPLIIVGWTEDERVPLKVADTKDIIFSKSTAILTIEQALYNNTTDIISTDFAVDLMEKLLPTQGMRDMNFFIKYAISSYLKNKNIHYLTFPTATYTFNQLYNLIDKNHNILRHNDIGDIMFDMFAEFGEYGISQSKGHLKMLAHKALAKFLTAEIIKRNILT
jgi:hypothetical protein